MSELINTSKERLEILNQMVELIVNHQDVDEYYKKYQEELKLVTPFDIFNILQFSDNGLALEEIKNIAGKLINLFRNGLYNYDWPKEKTSELMKNLLDEGHQIKAEFNKIKPLLREKFDPEILSSLFNKFIELDKRFLKMQNIIFPHLEKRLPNPRPLSVMWSLHDDAVKLLKELLNQLETNDPILPKTIGKFFFLVLGIIEKEELLVLPIASRLVLKEEWELMNKEAFEYGFSFIDVISKSNDIIQDQFNLNSKDLLFNTETGGLTLEELLLIFDKLDLDVTFVDEFNKVKFFNKPKNRTFPRTPSIIGRDVKKCHPPQSVHIVEEIIEHFRMGLKNEARFWIELNGRFIVITYYAIQNKDGVYQGVLEVSQDVTAIRKLTGEQRLLNWKK